MSASFRITLAPPLIYLLFASFAWALHIQLALPWPWPGPSRVVGWALLATALALMAWSVLVMFRHRTTVNPYGQPRALVTGGPFAWSRNPIYLGDSLAFASLALLLASPWPLLLLPAVMACMNQGVIEREERRLQATFGAAYDAYRARVRRWL